jgi:hypothetical protein
VVPAPLEAVQDQVELELEPAHVVEAGLGEVLLDMLDEVGGSHRRAASRRKVPTTSGRSLVSMEDMMRLHAQGCRRSASSAEIAHARTAAAQPSAAKGSSISP